MSHPAVTSTSSTFEPVDPMDTGLEPSLSDPPAPMAGAIEAVTNSSKDHLNSNSSTERIRTVSAGSDVSDTSDTSSTSSSSSYLSAIPMALRRNASRDNSPPQQLPSSSGGTNDLDIQPPSNSSPTPSSDSTTSTLPLDVDTDSTDSTHELSPSQVRVLDFSFTNLEVSKINAHLATVAFQPNNLTTLNLSGNLLTTLPDCLDLLVNLEALDISSNALAILPPSITALTKLNTLIASNNQLTSDSLPKNFGQQFSNNLKVLSLGGNLLTTIPPQLLELTNLQSLYLGGNQISEIPREIRKLINLKVLYLGGNQLTSIPVEVGNLTELQALSLCENKLRTLPSSIALLRNLKSLGLHKNLLTALPPEIVKLRGLQELSLRNNPLVSRFVKDFTFECPSLLELAARSIKIHKINYDNDSLPKCLLDYLSTARRCVNTKCKGVYFDARVEHIKFVDFCGIYRLPLLHYLCSPSCTSSNPAGAVGGSSSTSDSDDSYDEIDVPLNKLRRVLLG